MHDCEYTRPRPPLLVSLMDLTYCTVSQDGNFAGGLDMLERASSRWGIDPDAYT
ncbi:unnamed protein product [Ectocarpus sp. 12 AP-2014]